MIKHLKRLWARAFARQQAMSYAIIGDPLASGPASALLRSVNGELAVEGEIKGSGGQASPAGCPTCGCTGRLNADELFRSINEGIKNGCTIDWAPRL